MTRLVLLFVVLVLPVAATSNAAPDSPAAPCRGRRHGHVDLMHVLGLRGAGAPASSPVGDAVRVKHSSSGIVAPAQAGSRHRRVSFDVDATRHASVLLLAEKNLHHAFPAPPVNGDPLRFSVLGMRCDVGGATAASEHLELEVLVTGAVSSSGAASAAVNLFSRGRVLAGGREWGCGPVLERVLTGSLVDARPREDAFVVILHLQVEHVRPHEVLRDAHVRLRTNFFGFKDNEPKTDSPHQAVFARRPAAPTPPSSRPFANAKAVGGWWSWLGRIASDVWHEATKIAGEAEEVAKAVAIAGEIVATGDFQGNETKTLGSVAWNFDQATNQPVQQKILLVNEPGNTLACESCFLNLDVDFVFALDISDYAVQAFQVLLEGDAQFQIGAGASLSALANISMQFSFPTVHLPQVEFDIAGIPFSLNISIPTTASVSLATQNTVKSEAVVSAEGQVRLGVEQFAGTPIKYVNEHWWQRSGKGQSQVSELIMAVSVTPQLLVILDHIGGPFVRIQPFAEFALGADGNCDSGTSLAVNLGLQAGIGAILDVVIDGETIVGPYKKSKTFYSDKHTVFSGCAGAAPVVNQSATSARGLIAGRAWSGEFGPAPSCMLGWGNMTIQVLSASPESGWANIVAVMNIKEVPPIMGLPACFSCINQAKFSGQLENGVWYFQPEQDSVLLSACELPCQFRPPAPFQASVSSDWNSITVSIPSGVTGCDPIVLQ